MAIFKKTLIILFISGFCAPFLVFAQTGNHFGEQPPLSYEIRYLEPLGLTRVNETGIYYMPFACCSSFEEEFLPVQYFGDYPLYFSGGRFPFRVVIKNDSNRTYRNLKVETFQEFLNIDGGEGLAMGDNNKNVWFVEKLGPSQEVALEGEFIIPLFSDSGIDQTHLRISHWSNSDISKGQVILEDFQAGLWCPRK